jgi:hypothetical protein
MLPMKELTTEQQEAVTAKGPVVLISAAVFIDSVCWAGSLKSCNRFDKSPAVSERRKATTGFMLDCCTPGRQGFQTGATVNEEWRQIIGYEGLYEVSNLGNVRSLSRGNAGHKGRDLKASIGGHGYRVVSLCKRGVPIKRLVGRMVATAFIHNPSNKPQVNHRSGVKTDDRIENLEWVTSAENLEHAKQTGLQKNFCETHCRAILTNEQVVEIRLRYLPHRVTGNMLAKEFGVSRNEIYDIVKRRRFVRLP